MSWYKKSQDRDFDDIGKNHDYDPNWDYELDENVDEDFKAMIDFDVEAVTRLMLPVIGLFKNIEVHYVTHGQIGSDLAKYADGTHSMPVIMMDAQNIRNASRRFGISEEVIAHDTLMHEIGHAVQDAFGLPSNEEQAEEFARLVGQGMLDDAIKMMLGS